MSGPRPYSGPLYAGLRVGLLGGSFNPAHAGHRHISLYALKALGLDQVWWLVSPQNPLKPVKGMAPLAERLEEATARATAIQGFVTAGLPLRRALIEVGYTESQADEIIAEKDKDDAAQMERQRQMQAQGFDAEGNYVGEVDDQDEPDPSDNGGSRSAANGKGTPGGIMR